MRKFLIIILILGGAGIALYYGLDGKDKLAQIASDLGPADNQPSGEQSGVNEPADVFKEPIKYNSLKETFSGANFSFKHPDNFRVTVMPADQTGEVVAVENAKGSGFQIFAMPWDEKGMVTPERIWKDEPEADVLEPKVAELDGVQSLVFYGYNGDMGETFEVWAVNKGKLFQITGPKTAEELIIETLETWTWK